MTSNKDFNKLKHRVTEAEAKLAAIEGGGLPPDEYNQNVQYILMKMRLVDAELFQARNQEGMLRRHNQVLSKLVVDKGVMPLDELRAYVQAEDKKMVEDVIKQQKQLQKAVAKGDGGDILEEARKQRVQEIESELDKGTKKSPKPKK